MPLVEAELLCVIYVVVLEATLLSLDCFYWALVRLMDLMVVLSDYYEARLFPLTSSSTKMKSWEVMAHLPPLVIGSMGAAPLTPMLLMGLTSISSQEEEKAQDWH